MPKGSRDLDVIIIYANNGRISKVVKRSMINRRGHRCACCKGTDNLTVHHIIPISVDPRLRNRKSNLIVLCGRCHNYVGHCGDTGRYYNPRVLEDMQIENIELASQEAFLHRIPIPRDYIPNKKSDKHECYIERYRL